MRLISWNIDSLNAALTSDSARAKLTRGVLNTIKEKILILLPFKKLNYGQLVRLRSIKKILAEMFPDYDYVWRSSEEPARKGYAGTMFLYKIL